MSACGSCQSQQIVPWSSWRRNCPSSLVTIANYPLEIPSGTVVPAWAYLNVTALDRFDAAAAQAVIDEPESSSGSIPSSTSSSSSFTSSSSSATSSTSSPSQTVASSDSPSDKNNIPAIVGGTVGGVVGLGLVACLILFLFKRNSNKVPASAEFSKVIPPGSPVPVTFDPAAVGFRSHTTSPTHGLLNNPGGPYVIPSPPHQRQNSIPVPYAAPWSPPPATHTPAPNTGFYSTAQTSHFNQNLSYTPLPGTTGSPPMQQYPSSHSGSMGHTPSPYQGMPLYASGANGNSSFATHGTGGAPEI
ncbi:hypothetical protein FRC17_009039 [Serendipita sp. 399]|nr:hypothetical protein FRC17_009039 [Serendipita sp. 399]